MLKKCKLQSEHFWVNAFKRTYMKRTYFIRNLSDVKSLNLGENIPNVSIDARKQVTYGLNDATSGNISNTSAISGLCFLYDKWISMMFCTLTMSESLVFNKLIPYDFYIVLIKFPLVTSICNNTTCTKLFLFHFQTTRLADRQSDRFQDRDGFSDRSFWINGTIESQFKAVRISFGNNLFRGDFTFLNHFWVKISDPSFDIKLPC